jgi:small conductance mechanosensitive channel
MQDQEPQGINMPVDISNAWKSGARIINQFISLLPNMILAIIVFALFLFLASASKSVVQRVTRYRSRNGNLALLLGRISQATVVLIGLLISISIVAPSFQAGDIVKLLGVGGVAIGFAFRDILQNFLAGILLLLHEPFHVGDQIIITNFEGTVEDIQARATLIRTYDGRRVVIPNSDLFTNSLTVNTAFEKRRSEYDVGIGYGDDIEKAKQIILESLKTIHEVLPDPSPEVLTMDIGDYSVKLRTWWWTKPERASVMRAKDRVITLVKKNLTEAGIDLPFPTSQVLWHDQTESTDGDRSRQREGWPSREGEDSKPAGIAASIGRLMKLDHKLSNS